IDLVQHVIRIHLEIQPRLLSEHLTIRQSESLAERGIQAEVPRTAEAVASDAGGGWDTHRRPGRHGEIRQRAIREIPAWTHEGRVAEITPRAAAVRGRAQRSEAAVRVNHVPARIAVYRSPRKTRVQIQNPAQRPSSGRLLEPV